MHVLFFAQIKDVTDCEAVDLAVTAPIGTEQLWRMLVEKFPALAAHRANVRLALNWEYAGPNAQFSDADEVAVIPPVSGG